MRARHDCAAALRTEGRTGHPQPTPCTQQHKETQTCGTAAAVQLAACNADDAALHDSNQRLDTVLQHVPCRASLRATQLTCASAGGAAPRCLAARAGTPAALSPPAPGRTSGAAAAGWSPCSGRAPPWCGRPSPGCPAAARVYGLGLSPPTMLSVAVTAAEPHATRASQAAAALQHVPHLEQVVAVRLGERARRGQHVAGYAGGLGKRPQLRGQHRRVAVLVLVRPRLRMSASH
jgi:hypothetical protein